jgi:serine/threonine protein phosphatase PrpC
MEDAPQIIDPFLGGDAQGDQWGFYAIYDGHGGSQAVDYVTQNLHSVLLSELKTAKRGSSTTDARIAQALQRSFIQVDDQLQSLGTWKCGSTATVALVHKSEGSLRLHLANVGDSTAVLIDSSFQGHQLSFDHRPTDVKEVLRVEAEGGFVSRGRVNGQLGVSRALGDHWLKSSGVSASPHIVTRDVSNDIALVIASDGLWDALQATDVAMLIERKITDLSPDRLADMLVREAQRAGSTDNISCVVCLLDKALKCQR